MNRVTWVDLMIYLDVLCVEMFLVALYDWFRGRYGISAIDAALGSGVGLAAALLRNQLDPLAGRP